MVAYALDSEQPAPESHMTDEEDTNENTLYSQTSTPIPPEETESEGIPLTSQQTQSECHAETGGVIFSTHTAVKSSMSDEAKTPKQAAVPFCTVLIGEKPCQLLVDTGCGRSCLAEQTFASLPLDMRERLNEDSQCTNLVSASGHDLEVRGVVPIQWQFIPGGKTWEADFLVVRGLDEPLILGSNTLRALAMAICYKNNHLILPEEHHIPLQLHTSADEAAAALAAIEHTPTIPPKPPDFSSQIWHVKENVNIPPFMSVPVSVQATIHTPDGEYLLENLPSSNQQSIHSPEIRDGVVSSATAEVSCFHAPVRQAKDPPLAVELQQKQSKETDTEQITFLLGQSFTDPPRHHSLESAVHFLEPNSVPPDKDGVKSAHGRSPRLTVSFFFEPQNYPPPKLSVKQRNSKG